MLRHLRTFFGDQSIPPSHLVLALSGGIDSTALLLGMCELRADGFALSAAHVNHGLRDEESAGDEAFVRELCRIHEVPLHVADGCLDAVSIRRVGIEAAARSIRLQRLEEVRERRGAQWVATAHQKNDQAETVLMRILTGGGIGSLRGIRPVHDRRLLRPLLAVTRAEIEAFLHSRGVTARRDRMNADERFLRVRIRRLLEALEAGAVDNLAAVAGQVQLLWPAVEHLIDEAERGAVESSTDTTRFLRWPENRWMQQALLLRHIKRLDPQSRDVSSADLARIAGSLDDLKRQSVTTSLELVRRAGHLLLRRRPSTAIGFELFLGAGEAVHIPQIEARFSARAASTADFCASPDRKTQIIRLPPGADPRFVVRSRLAGDRFQPLGLPKAKKLKDFLIDRKIDAETRDRIPLLVWNGEIIWVAGVEISERFKVADIPGDLYEVRLERVTASDQEDQSEADLYRERDRQTDQETR